MSGRFSTGIGGGIAVARAERWNDRLCLAIIIVGTGLRLYHWVINRSLWLDESYLAVNILERGLGGLHQPLDFNQSAPWLFLVASKGMVALFGPGEMVLRFIPLLASVISLWVFWRLSKECLEGWVVPVALGVFTFSFRHVYYAQELKQYSVEMLLTTVLVWQTARMFRFAQAPHRYFRAMVITGGVGIFAMHAMPFILAGSGLIMVWARWRGKLNLDYARIVMAAGVWVVAFGVNYGVVIRPNYTNAVMKNYWAFAYPGMPWSVDGLRSWIVLVAEYFRYLGYGGWSKLAIALVICAGLWRVIRRENFVLLACAISVAAYWLAALAGKAPFSDRLLLFLFPMFLLFLGQGLTQLLHGRHGLIRAVGASVVLAATAKGLPALWRSFERENLRDPIIELSQLRQPSEPVYVMFWAVPGFQYYTRTLELTNLTRPVVVLNHQERRFMPSLKPGAAPSVEPDYKQLVNQIADLPGAESFWVLVAHMSPRQDDEFLREIRTSLGLSPGLAYTRKRCHLYRFDRDRQP